MRLQNIMRARKRKKIGLLPSEKLHLTNTISDAFRAINGRYGVFVALVNDNDSFCGIVSEGDLRRAILSGISLDAPLEKIMNAKPVFLQIDDLYSPAKCSQALDEIYKCYGATYRQQATIPVLDKQRRLMGLVTTAILETRRKFSSIVQPRKSGSPSVLVVGGAGYIGSVLSRMLIDDGWRVRVLDNMLYGQRSLEGIRSKHISVMYGDVTNINDLVEAIESIDAVVYLAEIVGDPACAHSPERALKTNYLAVTNMAHLCSYLNIRRFIYTSSCSVYGGASSVEYLTEESKLRPVSHYARMKILTEQAILGIPNSLFAPTILRLATVFGYSFRPRFDLVVNAFAKNAYFKSQIDIFGGRQWRPNVHVKDVARAIIRTLDSPVDKVGRQVFNVGANKENYTVNDLAQLTAKHFPGIRILYHRVAGDLRNYRVDFSKIEKIMKFTASLSVSEGLLELKKVFKSGKVKDPDDPCFSNLQAIQALAGKAKV